MDHGSQRNLYNPIFPFLTCAVFRRACSAVISNDPLDMVQVAQRSHPFSSNDIDATSPPTIPTVRPSLWPKLCVNEGDGSITTLTRFYGQLPCIYHF